MKLMKRFKANLLQVKKVLSLLASLSKAFLPLTLFICMLDAVSPFITIVGSSMLIDGFMQKLPIPQLLFIAAAAIALNILIVLVLGILNKKIELAYYIIDKRSEMLLSAKILEMDYEHIENPATHKLKESITMDQMTMGGIWNVFFSLRSMIRSAISIIISIVVLWGMFSMTQGSVQAGYGWINSPLFLILLCGVVLGMIGFTSWFSAYSSKKEYGIIDEMVDGNRIFMYFIGMIQNYKSGKDIRVYNGKDMIRKEIDGLFDQKGGAFSDICNVEGLDAIVSGGASSIIGGLGYIYVGLKAWLGILPIGSVVRYAGAIHEFIGSFSSLIGRMTDLISMCNRLQNVFEFLSLPDAKYHGTLTVEKRVDNEYELVFHNVSFHYPGTEKYVLKNLNLKLNIGKRLAIVGMNGSGKTTMIKLLCRLYDPTQGEITLNGIDIKKYDYAEYMGIFSVVFQDFKLFSFSLGQNIASNIEIDEEKAHSSLIKAGFGERLSMMENGLDTPLYKDFDEAGVEISGGEAQKIALARALYKDAPFIVLDEPTAALDPIAEFEIYSKFNEIVGEKTAIFISHRLSSCRFCDDIAVFHEGEMIQRGSHQRLLAIENGKYCELWNAQAQYYR